MSLYTVSWEELCALVLAFAAIVVGVIFGVSIGTLSVLQGGVYKSPLRLASTALLMNIWLNVLKDERRPQSTIQLSSRNFYEKNASCRCAGEQE